MTWKQQLIDFLCENINIRTRMVEQGRRFPNHIMEYTREHVKNTLVLYIDTSGVAGDHTVLECLLKDIAECATEADMDIEYLDVHLFADESVYASFTEVDAYDMFLDEILDELKAGPSGGLAPVYHHMQEEYDYDYDGAVIFTDGGINAERDELRSFKDDFYYSGDKTAYLVTGTPEQYPVSDCAMDSTVICIPQGELSEQR